LFHILGQVSVCNSSYPGSKDQEDFSSRSVGAKSKKGPIATNKLDIVEQTCHLSCMGGIDRITVQSSLGKKA
jgi:hypothetical protein